MLRAHNPRYHRLDMTVMSIQLALNMLDEFSLNMNDKYPNDEFC